MNLSDAQKRSAELEEWIGIGLQEAHVPAGENVQLAYALFDLVQEHHRAISILLERGQPGSAFTLMRPSFETLVRGTWLARAAGERGVKEFLRDSPPSIGDQLKALESTEFGAWFLDFKNFGWSAMCSYAHGGQFHAARRMSSEAIELQYEPEAQVQVLRMAGFLALLAALQCGSISGLTEFAQEAAKRATTWYADIVDKS